MHVRRTHYIGVAPLPGRARECLRGGAANAGQPAPHRACWRSLAADPLLAGSVRGARMVGDAVSLGPLAVDCSGAGAPGLLLAGDAAGFVDPMTGDGLRFAFRGGELAALEALGALSSRTGERRAPPPRGRARAASSHRKWRFNRTLRLLVASRARCAPPATRRHSRPQVLRRAIRYAGDVHAA